MSFVIDKMSADDWEQVRAVYLEGIATGHATFETQAPSWEEWDARHLPYSRRVARDGETVKGWAALSPVSSRFVYAGVAEISVYVGQNHRGEGVGKALLDALISDSENNGIWSLQAGIFPENSRSITMHKQCGFREVGKRERIGKMNGVWRDTVLLERRSKVVGTD
ncbi:MAG TPA: GNAT family N-acetyltransferase [Pyrinomonadaceae bacterium]|jgi:phosphinothricin acetyltransferase